MLFGGLTLVGPRNHVLDRGPDPPRELALLMGVVQAVVKYRDYVVWMSSAKMAALIELPYG